MNKDAFSSIRATKLNFYLRCMRIFGYKHEDVLEGTGINKVQLSDPYQLIEVSSYIRVVLNMLRLTNSSDLPFRLGQELIPGDLGILGHAVSSCCNTQEGLDLWRRYNWFFFGNLFYSSESVENSRKFYEYNPRVKLLPHLVQFFIEEKINVDFTLFKKFNNCQVQCRYYGLTYPAPPHSRLYEEIIGVPATFNTDRIRYAVDLNEEVMERPFRWADQETANVCKSYIDQITTVATSHITLTAKTRHLISEFLPKILTVDEMAQQFNLSGRTYCRYLSREKIRYQDLIASVRMETAKNFLTTTSYSVQRIAEHLGFADSGSLRRSFKSSTGMTISDFKKMSWLPVRAR